MSNFYGWLWLVFLATLILFTLALALGTKP
jgi:hypothetical protein